MNNEVVETQIYFDNNFSSNDYIIMEVDEHIADELLSSENLYVRGYKTDEVVICTQATTNKCKEKAIMNSSLLFDGVYNLTKILVISNSFYEINRATPNMISRIKQLFSEQEINLFDEDFSTNQIRGISWTSLLSQLQISEDELKKELDKYPVFQNNGKLYSINKRTIWKLLDFITEICCKGQIVTDRLDLEILRTKLSEKITDNLIAWFIRIFCVRNDAGFYSLNESEFSRARAEQILICSDQEQFKYNEFEQKVNNMLPSNFTFNAEVHLNGLALIDNSQFFGKTIRKLLISELPADLHKRLSILFSLKNSWTKEEIQPYILEYCPNQTKIDGFLLSHCRITGTASNRSYVYKKFNY